MNRLTRDAILLRALDLVDAPSLDAHDRPASTIVAGAHTIGWLQDGLDYLHHLWPWGGTVKTASISFSQDDETKPLPSDFILDYKHGLMFETEKARARRTNLNRILGSDPARRGRPTHYAIHTPNIRPWPRPDKAYTAKLYYYSLPGTLAGTDIPNFPSDWVLVEYVRMRCLEWTTALGPGTAMEFLNKYAADLQKSGIGPELEDDTIELDPEVHVPQPGDDPLNGWMGSSAITPI